MKNCVGFDIGNHAVHVAVRKGGEIVRSVSERLPEGLVLNGRITSVEAMSDMLKEIRRNNKIRIKNAALVLPAGLCYCRRFTIAAMSKDQLLFNLPYEFHDFITDDKRNYFFDYAVVGVTKDEQGNPTEYDLIGAATRKDVIADYSSMFNKAGFKLKIAIPEELAYVNILRSIGGEAHKHAILDIGHNAVRLFMFLGDQFESVRVIDYGCNALDVVISEKYGVDDHYLSSTYRETNYEGANELDGCREIYNAMTIEILKAVNFYRFNGGGRLEHLHCCGGGAKNEVLIDTLRRGLPLEVTDLSEFFGKANSEQAAKTASTAPQTAEQEAQTEEEQPQEPSSEEEQLQEPSAEEEEALEASEGEESFGGESDENPQPSEENTENGEVSEMGEAPETEEPLAENSVEAEEAPQDEETQEGDETPSDDENNGGTQAPSVPTLNTDMDKSDTIDYAVIVAAAGATMQ